MAEAEKLPQFATVAKGLPENLTDEQWESYRAQWFDVVLWPELKKRGAKQDQYPETLSQFEEKHARPGKSDWPKAKQMGVTAGSTLLKPIAKAVDAANGRSGAPTLKALNAVEHFQDAVSERQGVSGGGQLAAKLAGGVVGGAPYFIPIARALSVPLAAAGATPAIAGAVEGAAGGGLYEAAAANPGEEMKQALIGAGVGGVLGGATGKLAEILARAKAGSAEAAAATGKESLQVAPRRLPAPTERVLQVVPPETGWTWGQRGGPSAEYVGWRDPQLPPGREPIIDAEFTDIVPPDGLLRAPGPAMPFERRLPAPGTPLRSEGRPVIEEPSGDFLRRNERQSLRERITAGTAAKERADVEAAAAAESEARITAFDKTVPELRSTLEAQMDQLTKGVRGAVLLPADAEGFLVPKGHKTTTIEGVGKIVYDPKFRSVDEIRKAVKQNRLAEILGAREGGYGAPDKTALGEGQIVVVARNERGIVTQEVLTDAANVERTVGQLRKLGTDVQVEPVENTLARRSSGDTIPSGSLFDVAANERRAGAEAAGGDRSGVAFSEPRPAKAPVVLGADTSIKTPHRGTAEPAVYEVRELDDIYPSHNGLTFQQNQEFAWQNTRNYHSEQSQQRKVLTAVELFDPEYVVNTNPTATNGPPVIDGSGNVLGGNGRAMTMQRAFQQPEKLQAYRKRLADSASMYGLDAAAIQRMRQPVLVRRLLDMPDEAGARRIIADLNPKETFELSSTEQAIADAGRVSEQWMRDLDTVLFDAGDDASLGEALSGRNGTELMQRLVKDGVVESGDLPKYFDGGKLTPDGNLRIQRMLLGRMLSSVDQFNATPPAIRNKLQRLSATVAQLSSQRPEWDPAPMISKAVDLIELAGNHKMSIEDYLANGSITASLEFSDAIVGLAQAIRDLKPTELAARFRELSTVEQMSRPGVSSMTMFGEPPTFGTTWSELFPRANTGRVSGRKSTAIPLRDRPTGLQGTTGGEPLPGAPEGVTAATWETAPGKAASMLREPSRLDQYHEGVHRIVVENLPDPEATLRNVDPVMADKLAKALPKISGGREGLYSGIVNEEVSTRLFTAIRMADDDVIDAFVKADDSIDEVMRFASKQAEEIQRFVAALPDGPQRRIYERKMQDIRRRARQGFDDLKDDLAIMDAEVRMDGEKIMVRMRNEKGFRAFGSREQLETFLERNGEWPKDAPEFVSASDALPGTGGLPPTGGPRMRFNTETVDAPAAPEVSARLGVNYFSFLFRPALAWYHTAATKMGMPELYLNRMKLDEGALLAQTNHHRVMEQIIGLKGKYKIGMERATDLFYHQAAQRLKAEGFTGGPTFEAVDAIARNLKMSKHELDFLAELRPMLDKAGQEFGISPERWSQEYISIMRKMTYDPDFSLNAYRPPNDLKFFAEELFAGRTGELETNLFRVLDTYLRLGYRKKYMEEPYRALHKAINQKALNESDMVGLLRGRMNRDLEFMRGMPDKGQKAIESTMGSVIDSINLRMAAMREKAPAWARPYLKGIESPPADAVRKLTVMQYAGSMGLRPKTYTMNLLQPMLAFPMMDGDSFAFGVANALSKANVARAKKFMVLASEADMSQIAAGEEVGISGTIGKAAQWSLSPQRWTDNLTRLVSFSGFHRQVSKAMKDFKAIEQPGPANLQAFISRSSMQYLDPMMAQDFARRVAAESQREALEDLAGQISHRLTETTQWSFTRGAAPGAYKWGAGRLLGMYGTWPMNYVEYLRRILGNPQLSKFERMKTLSKFAAVHFGIYEAGRAAGVNLHSQVFLGPAGYSGGPYLGALVNAPTAIADWDTNRGREARKQVIKPIQTFVPGYIAFKDLAEAVADDNPNLWEKILDAQGYRIAEEE